MWESVRTKLDISPVTMGVLNEVVVGGIIVAIGRVTKIIIPFMT